MNLLAESRILVAFTSDNSSDDFGFMLLVLQMIKSSERKTVKIPVGWQDGRFYKDWYRLEEYTPIYRQFLIEEFIQDKKLSTLRELLERSDDFIVSNVNYYLKSLYPDTFGFGSRLFQYDIDNELERAKANKIIQEVLNLKRFVSAKKFDTHNVFYNNCLVLGILAFGEEEIFREDKTEVSRGLAQKII